MLAIFKNKLQKSSCYSSCSEVCLTTFVNAIVKSDYSGLIKSGSPTPDELLTAWEAIFNEYLTISGDTHIRHLLALKKDIAFLTGRIILLDFIVAQIAEKHHPLLAEQLRSLGFRFQYNDGPELQRELALTQVQAKALQVQLNQSEAELKDLDTGDGEAATEMDYEMQLSELGKFQGYSIDPDKITVTRYCAIVKRFKLQNSPKVA